jgi:hypothetical protein
MTSSEGNKNPWHTKGWWVAAVGIATIAATVIALVAYVYPRSSNPRAATPSSVLTNTSSAAPAVLAPTITSPPAEASPAVTAAATTSDAATNNVPSPPPPAPRVQSVKVQTGDYQRVGAGLYQLSGSTTLQLRYWWTTMTNYGAMDYTDTSCTVVGVITNTSSGEVVDVERSATCTLEGWHSAQVPQGSFKLTVAVTLESGAKGGGTTLFRVIP